MKFDDALQPLLARLRTSYARSPLPAFFAWWGGELRACLPQRWRGVFEDRVDTLLLDTGAEGLVIYRASQPGQPPVASIPGRLSVEEQRLALNKARNALDDPRVRMVLCLPRARVLLRSMKLPAAAENNLSQVLGFEMDRQTPFKADQVYADQAVTARDPETRALSVDMAVVPKPVMDAELKKLEPLELALDGVDAWAGPAGGGRLGFNLLPPTQRVRQRNMRMRLNLALAGVAVVLMVTAMSLWVSNREEALASMQGKVADIQKQATQVASLRKGLAESIKGASFLIRKKIDTPSTVELIRALTHALDDDTFLQRLSIDDNQRVSLQGQGAHAASLLEKVAAIPSITDASFQGVIQPDAASGKERFNILATVVMASPIAESDNKDNKDNQDNKGKADAPAEAAQ